MNSNDEAMMSGRSILRREIVLEIDRLSIQGFSATPFQAERIREEIKLGIEERLRADPEWRPRPSSENISITLDESELDEWALARAVAARMLQALSGRS